MLLHNIIALPWESCALSDRGMHSTVCNAPSLMLEQQGTPILWEHLDSGLEGQEDGVARVGRQPQRLEGGQHRRRAGVKGSQEAP